MSEAPIPEEPATIVNDPIRIARQLRRFEFVRAPLEVSADAALILIGADGSLSTYSANHQPTRGELAWRSYVKLYEVDLGHHHQSFSYDLPSAGDAFFFHAEVDVSWHVENPETVVRHGVRDVRATIEPVLRKVLTSVTRQFDIEQSATAEAAANNALEKTRIGTRLGLQVSCIVRLRLDAQAMEHFTTIRQHTYQKVQDEVQHITAAAAAQQEHELTQRNVEFFRTLFHDADDMWALLLDRNPDNVAQVLDGRRSDERDVRATRLQALQKVLDAGVLEGHMLEEQVRMALESLPGVPGPAAEGTAMQRPMSKQQLPPREPSSDDED